MVSVKISGMNMTAQFENPVDISPAAEEYLEKLLASKDEGCGIRIFVVNPGTPNAETQIAYCNPGEQGEGDVAVEYNQFTAWFEERSLPFLDGAEVDYRGDQMGGQITLRAPNARVPKVSDDAPIEDRINYVLYNEINPGLAAHGGVVSLVEVKDDNTAVLQFGGGCQGCAAVDITLKQGVEASLLQQVPDLKAIVDETDHSDTTNSYY